MLSVSEIFGPTFQGEGPYAGRRCGFIRLGGCNLHCVWCDSAYTWRFSDTHDHVNPKVFNRKEELTRWDMQLLLKRMLDMNLDHWVITGGEPLLQEQELAHLLWAHTYQLKGNAFYEIETAGTIEPKSPKWSTLNVHYNVSPKLEHSGNTLVERYHPEVLQWFGRQGKVAFKFVARDEEDLDEISGICKYNKIPAYLIWIMPLGVDGDLIDSRLREMSAEVLMRGWNMTNRLHIQIWGNIRGV